jgi:hypothetical protein
MSDFTTNRAQVLDWTTLDDTATDTSAYVSTGVQTVTEGTIEARLHIVVAHQDATDAGTSYVNISVMERVGADDEGWREHIPLQAGGGQATMEGLDNTTSGTTIPVDATTDWDDADGGVWLFLKDVGTLADSCLVHVVGWNDGVSYVAANAMENTYDASDELYDGVDQFEVILSPGISAYQVVFFNTHGSATYAVRVDISEVTDIE